MTAITVTSGVRRAKLLSAGQRYVSVLATLLLLIVMFLWGTQRYDQFASGQLLLNLFVNKSFLLVLAVGMTFVILTGGIDLSVGSVIALTTVMGATLLEHHWPVYAVLPFVLTVGVLLGAAMGAIIHFFDIQPFIVTLAGMFFARGVSYLISSKSVTVTDPAIRWMALKRFPLGPDPLDAGSLMAISFGAVVAIMVAIVAFFVLHYSRLGRNVYAIGGNEQSAMLMGLPVGATKIAVYAVSGFCSSLGGILFMLYSTSGDSTHAVGMELSAIAAVVIGGTLLTGGSGYLAGTVLGVLVLGMIDSLILYEGLNSWWSKIAIGALVLVFILLQRAIAAIRK